MKKRIIDRFSGLTKSDFSLPSEAAYCSQHHCGVCLVTIILKCPWKYCALSPLLATGHTAGQQSLQSLFFWSRQAALDKTGLKTTRHVDVCGYVIGKCLANL